MKIYLPVLLSVLASTQVLAVDFTDTAKVVSTTPIYERVSEPKQECWNETVSTSGGATQSAPVEEHSIGGAIVGGVIGGVVGSQVGQGNGNTVATGAGAIAGAIIGDRVANKNTRQQTSQVPQTREERHCRQVENFREVIRGYNVTYLYNGREISTRMSSPPGETVQVGISVLGETVGNDARDVRGDEGFRGKRSWNRDQRDRRYDDE